MNDQIREDRLQAFPSLGCSQTLEVNWKKDKMFKSFMPSPHCSLRPVGLKFSISALVSIPFLISSTASPISSNRPVSSAWLLLLLTENDIKEIKNCYLGVTFLPRDVI